MRVVPALLLGAVALAAAPGASAAAVPCLPGAKSAKCKVWTGKVRAVDDGDTVTVRIAGVGVRKVRVTGIQAMELTRYGRRAGRRGECNAVRAANRLEAVVRRNRGRVRLTALRSGSTTGERGRLRRSLAVKVRGRWVDPAAELLKAGLALWFPNGVEWASNRSYALLAARAARKRIGIWNPRACGAGPARGARLSMKVKWDANGQDPRNLNGEWARITNHGRRAVSLAGWWFRDSHLRRYRFPRSAKVAPNGSVRVLMGRGRNTRTRFHWGLGETIFENVVGGRRAAGDGGYLFDPRGDLRAFVQYPCRIACRDPLAGKIDVRAAFRGTEYVTIRNTSSGVVDLSEYELESSPWFYEFARGTRLAPRRSLVLYIGRGPSRRDAIVRSWGFRIPLLADRRDVVTLRNPLGAPVDCHAWGGFPCPRV